MAVMGHQFRDAGQVLGDLPVRCTRGGSQPHIPGRRPPQVFQRLAGERGWHRDIGAIQDGAGLRVGATGLGESVPVPLP
jgi:hypothetical protein